MKLQTHLLSQHVVFSCSVVFPSGFAHACWCSPQHTPVGVKADWVQSDFILAWLRVCFFFFFKCKNKMFVGWNQSACFYFSLFWRCIFWSLMLIVFMSYHLSSSGKTFFSSLSALELPQSRSKSAVHALPLFPMLSVQWVCSRSFVCFGFSMCCYKGDKVELGKEENLLL